MVLVMAARPIALASAASAAIALASLAGCPGTLTLEEKQHLAYDCPDVPSVILARRCATAGCHDAATQMGGLDLGSPRVEQRLLGVPSNGGGALIDLHDPENSVLLLKMSERPPFGARMPEQKPPIDAQAYACIHAWVLSFLPPTTPVDSGSPSPVADADASDDASDADASDADASDAADQDAAEASDATDASDDVADETG
jgi:hypothetical protein